MAHQPSTRRSLVCIRSPMRLVAHGAVSRGRGLAVPSQGLVHLPSRRRSLICIRTPMRLVAHAASRGRGLAAEPSHGQGPRIPTQRSVETPLSTPSPRLTLWELVAGSTGATVYVGYFMAIYTYIRIRVHLPAELLPGCLPSAHVPAAARAPRGIHLFFRTNPF